MKVIKVIVENINLYGVVLRFQTSRYYSFLPEKINQPIGRFKREVDNLVCYPAIIDAEEKVELGKRLLEVRRMYVVLIVEPIENGVGQISLCDDILLTVIERAAFITPL